MARFMFVPYRKKEHSHMEDEEHHHLRHASKHDTDTWDDEAHMEDGYGMKTVREVLDAFTPATWDAYKDKLGGYWHILDMEESELANARAAVKGGTKTEKAVVKELSHVAAACIYAINCISKK